MDWSITVGGWDQLTALSFICLQKRVKIFLRTHIEHDNSSKNIQKTLKCSNPNTYREANIIL